MVTILMMPAKMAFLGLLKIMVFWNKSYGVKITLYDVHHCGKRVKTNRRKVLGANSYAYGSYREKPGRGGGCPPLSWIGLTSYQQYIRVYNVGYSQYIAINGIKRIIWSLLESASKICLKHKLTYQRTTN